MTRDPRRFAIRFAAGALATAMLVAWIWSEAPKVARHERRSLPVGALPVVPSLPSVQGASPRDAARSNVAPLAPAAAEAGAAASDDVLAVHVVDGDDTPIAAARIFVAEGDDARELGSTDASGVARVDSAQLERAWHESYARLICRHRGFALATRFVASDERRVVLRLRPATRIGGRVVDREGAAVGGVRVVAWEAALGPAGPELFTRVLADHPGVHAVESDASGRFEFDDLDAEHAYSITAGGNGLLAARPAYGIETGTDDLCITLVRAFGARLRIAEEGGRPVRLPHGLSPASVLQFPVLRADARIGSAEYGSEMLLGLDADARDLESLDFALVMTSSGDDVALGPFALSIDVPGYQPKVAPYELGRLPDELRRYTIELRRQSECSGRVVVSAVGSDDAPDTELRRGALRVQLVLAAAERAPLCFDLSLDGRRACTLEGIPCGRYEASVRWPQGADALLAGGSRSTSLEVGNDLARVEIDTARLGRVRVVVRASTRREDEAFDGPLVVKWIEIDPLHPDEPGRAGSFAFQHGPYELSSVPEGDYSFLVSEPPALAEGGGCFADLRVSTDRIATAEFRLVASVAAK